MNILFVHQNFPGQYRNLAPILAAEGHAVVAIGEETNVQRLGSVPNIRIVAYPKPQGASPQTHHYLRDFEAAVRRGQAVARAAISLHQSGFRPDVIYAHPGWGEALYLKDVFPDTPLLCFCEFYYRATGSDVGFDPEYPAQFDDHLRVRTKNTTHLLSLIATDWAISPTHWQARQFPPELQAKLSVIHDGIDTQHVTANPAIQLTLSRDALTLTRRDEVITFVNRNMEPYRGFHCFMRALPAILQRRPNAHILIVGGDEVSYGKRLPEGQSYRQLLLHEVGARLDMRRVHFLGRIPYNQFLAVLQISSAHVYLTYPFVLSWSMLEAMAAECLVIGSRTPPVEEVIRDGENGLLVDFFAADELVETLDRVLTTPQAFQAVRQQARQTILEQYDLRTVCLPRQRQLIELLASGQVPTTNPWPVQHTPR